jgi:ribosomal-protein-alanine N-acetyltransferase
MSALPCDDLVFRVMTAADLDVVMGIENVIYTHPWTRGNFEDTLIAGGHAWIMLWRGIIVGYAVLTTGAGEGHLMNLSVAASWQRRGLGRALLLHVLHHAHAIRLSDVFLEVRVSNAAAIALYQSAGFHQIGMRRGYYPAHVGREDAIVLKYQP